MFNPFTWLDGILLGAMQKLCDAFQRITGLTKFWLEKWALIASMAFLWTMTGSLFDGTLIIMSVMITFIAFLAIQEIEEAEKGFLQDGKPRFSVWHNAFARLSVAITFVSFVVVLLFLMRKNALLVAGMMGSYIAMAYISACVPRPPSKSRMRQWYESGLTWLNEKLAPPPAPVPSS